MFRTFFRAGFLIASLTACEFKFDVTSQRTALENQVMGSYKELDDDLVLISSVRAPGSKPPQISANKRKALDAKQNQDFNRDDIDELKDAQLLGEERDGKLAMLPTALAQNAKADAARLALARALVDEENADRSEIWRRIIASNENLSAKDLPEVQRTYAKMQRENAAPGHWYQDDAGQWQRKAPEKQAASL